MPKNQMKDIRIVAAMNGWVISVGCATVVSMSKDAMLSEIGRYIDNPSAVEKEYAANAVNRDTYIPDEDSDERPRRSESLRPRERAESAEDCEEPLTTRSD